MTGTAAELLKPAELLNQWLKTRLTAEQTTWFETQLQKIQQSNSDRELHITLGMIPRKLGRADLSPTDTELAEADRLEPGWDPQNWSIDITARVVVMCLLAELRPEGFATTITDLCRYADLAESIALYSGVSVYPQSVELDRLIGEGLRTNIRSVFEAIAHRNPYPAKHFDENRWNHMVLKALFIDSTLAPIVGLDKRANANLARILCDYANERRAAGRPVSHELWRCVGPFASGDIIDDLERATHSESRAEKEAAFLALNASTDERAKDILAAHSAIQQQIANGSLTLDSIEQQQKSSNVS